MKPKLAISSLFLLLLAVSSVAEAVRVRVGRPRHRVAIRVHAGFPLHRRLPHVYVRHPRVVVRVAPKSFLPPVVFGASVMATQPADEDVVWRGTEMLDREEEWTELTMNIDRRGDRLLFEVAQEPAQISFVEVVFENGDAQVIDFNDRAQALGTYSLLNFKDGRKVDHVRLVAKTEAEASAVSVALLK